MSDAVWRWPLRVAALFASGLLMITTLFSVCLGQGRSQRGADVPSRMHDRAAQGSLAGPVMRTHQPSRQPRISADPTLFAGSCVCSEPKGW